MKAKFLAVIANVLAQGQFSWQFWVNNAFWWAIPEQTWANLSYTF